MGPMSADQPDRTVVDIDQTHFRSVLGHYPTGVCVVTGRTDGHSAAGLVIGTFSSVSLDPPMVGFYPARASGSWGRIRQGGRFCVNVLGADQMDLSRKFAARGGNKFQGVSHRTSPHGLAILDDVVATIECDIVDERDAGDHTMVLGQVIALEIMRSAPPLLFFRGEYGTFAPLAAVGADD
jgi:3-hydroxy-9,10-secoandrosta-1,3,5(10)-triene-9,17-dione monooxygenase reductase component